MYEIRNIKEICEEMRKDDARTQPQIKNLRKNKE